MRESLPQDLRDFTGRITVPEDAGFSSAVEGMQTGVTIRPDLVVEPLDTDDVRRAVAHAARGKRPLLASGTGHGASSVGAGLLIRTRQLAHVRIDPRRQIAEVGPGATWAAVGAAAAAYDLTALSGTAATVGAVGYTLGGGLSPLSREYGYATDHVLSLDLVTPDGELRHVTAEREPELFWAARGAGSNIGIVTGLHCRLFPISHVLAGALVVSLERWAEVVDRYVDWTANVSNEMSSYLSLMNFPDHPQLPEVIRGKRTATIFVTSTGAEADVNHQLEQLRELPLEADTVARTAPVDLPSVFNEPTHPHAFQGDALAVMGVDAEPLGTTLRHLSAADIAEPKFLFVHHLGGAMSNGPEPANVMGNRAARYMVRMVSPLAPNTDTDAVATEQAEVLGSLGIAPTGRVANFLFGDNRAAAPLADCYDQSALERLTHLTRQVDPDGLLRLGRGTFTPTT